MTRTTRIVLFTKSHDNGMLKNYTGGGDKDAVHVYRPGPRIDQNERGRFARRYVNSQFTAWLEESPHRHQPCFCFCLTL